MLQKVSLNYVQQKAPPQPINQINFTGKKRIIRALQEEATKLGIKFNPNDSIVALAKAIDTKFAEIDARRVKAGIKKV